MCFSFPYFSLVSGRTGRGTGRERERKRDHPLRDRVMDITDTLYNPPEFTIPSILITKKKKKYEEEERKKEKRESEMERKRWRYFQSAPSVCVCISARRFSFLFGEKNVFVAPGRKEEEDFSIILVDDLPTNQPPAIIKNKKRVSELFSYKQKEKRQINE